MTQHPASPARAVLYDFSGVLAEEGFISGLRAIAAENGLDPQVFVRAATDVCYTSGYADGLAPASAFWQGVRQVTGITHDDATLQEAVLSRFVIRPDMFADVDALREQGLTVALVSDHTDWLETLDDRHGVFHHFDHAFSSFREKRNKRTGELFDRALDVLGLAPEQTMFFDDNAGNVERAILRGIDARLFTDKPAYRADLASRLPHLRMP